MDMRHRLNLPNVLILLVVVVMTFAFCTGQAEAQVEGVRSWRALVLDQDNEGIRSLTEFAEEELRKHGMQVDEDAPTGAEAQVFIMVICWHVAGDEPTFEDTTPTVTQECTVDVDVVRVGNLYPGQFRLVSVWSALTRCKRPEVRRTIRDMISMVSQLREDQLNG